MPVRTPAAEIPPTISVAVTPAGLSLEYAMFTDVRLASAPSDVTVITQYPSVSNDVM